MDINAAFPSNWLKAADLQGRDIQVTIKEVVSEDIGDGHKPVVYFTRGSKGLVLNKTNALTIAEVYGNDTDKWMGAVITVYPDKTQFQGRRVDCIRVRCSKPMQQPGNGRPSIPATGPRDLDDEIPF